MMVLIGVKYLLEEETAVRKQRFPEESVYHDTFETIQFIGYSHQVCSNSQSLKKFGGK
jgi:hypothetical protein